MSPACCRMVGRNAYNPLVSQACCRMVRRNAYNPLVSPACCQIVGRNAYNPLVSPALGSACKSFLPQRTSKSTDRSWVVSKHQQKIKSNVLHRVCFSYFLFAFISDKVGKRIYSAVLFLFLLSLASSNYDYLL